MNVKLKKVFNFSTGLVYDNEFSVNYYTVTVHMTLLAENEYKQNIAYERLKYWIDYVLANSILIHDADPMIEKWLATEQRIIMLPDQPVDQLVGIMLFLKLNAILEEIFVITEVELSSTVGDDMGYIHTYAENLGPMDYDGWWNDSRPTWVNQTKKQTKNGKVIKLGRTPEWKELELSFDEDGNDSPSNDSVVFVNFSKDDKK
jgi:hypothetical protein